MEPLTPAYSTSVMLLIAAGAVALLLFLIIKVKLHAFIALVLISVLTALAVRVPLADIPDVLLFGFGGTLAEVALLVGFGVMLGRLLEVSGGAQILADTLIARFGEKRAPFALGVASLLFGFPIFFDAGLVVFLPIILSVATRFGGSLLLYALPSAGAFAAMHAIVPPHPGPVAAAQFLGADVGYALLIGTPVAVLSWYVGVYLFARRIGQRIYVPVPHILGGTDDKDELARRQQHAPSFALVVGLLLLPLVLITANTVVSTLISAGVVDEAGWTSALLLIGQTPIALLITVLVAIAVIGTRGRSMADVEKLLNDALGPICAIILITGAGGMFGGVLELSGIGESLAASLDALGLPLIVAAFVIATGLRVAQGSATVALTTAAGLIAPAVDATAGLNQVDLVALVIAIAAGATVLSHVNDSGFWLVSRFFEMDEKTTLKTWTVMETTLGTTAFAISVVLWYVF
ncbi:MAG TPA: GntP family permease [Nocardioidaceae bacterium]|nr:GntP family permease [Nocardioidaceae bacterium]